MKKTIINVLGKSTIHNIVLKGNKIEIQYDDEIHAENQIIDPVINQGDSVNLILVESNNKFSQHDVYKDYEIFNVQTVENLIDLKIRIVKAYCEDEVIELIDSIPERSEIYVDTTFANMRMYQMIITALSFVSKYKMCEVERITYTEDTGKECKRIQDTTSIFYVDQIMNKIDCNYTSARKFIEKII